MPAKAIGCVWCSDSISQKVCTSEAPALSPLILDHILTWTHFFD